MTKTAPEATTAQTPAPLPPEPTFLLRGRDAGTDEALITYHQRAKDLGADKAELDRIQKAIDDFREFPVSVVPGREGPKDAPGSSLKPAPAPDKAEPAKV
jgi:hypothetical protein